MVPVVLNVSFTDAFVTLGSPPFPIRQSDSGGFDTPPTVEGVSSPLFSFRKGSSAVEPGSAYPGGIPAYHPEQVK